MSKCLICSKLIPERNKYKVCSNCGNKNVYTLLREGFIIKKYAKDNYHDNVQKEVKK